jgi:hypothetical protein
MPTQGVGSATHWGVERCNRMTEEMDAAKIRLYVGQGLQSQIVRNTCGALENLHDAIAALETLPVPAIEALQDYVAERYGKREGAVGEFARAYLKYLETPLAAAKILGTPNALRYRGVGEDDERPRTETSGTAGRTGITTHGRPSH